MTNNLYSKKGEEKKKKHKIKKDSKEKKKENDLKDGKEKKESKNDKKIKDAKDDKNKTKKGRGFSFFGKKSKDSKDDKKKKDLKDEKKKKSHLRKQRSTTKSPDAAANGGISGQRGTPNQETAVEFSLQHRQKQHATPSKQKKTPEGFPEPYTVPNIEKLKIPSSTCGNKAPKKISSFEHLKQQKPPSKNEKIKPNRKSDSDVPAPFGTPLQKKCRGKKRSKKNPSEVASTPPESPFKQKSTNARLPVLPQQQQQHRPRHIETVETPKQSHPQQSSGLISSGDKTPAKQEKSKEKAEKPHEILQPPSSSGLKSSSKSGKRVVRTSKFGEKLFQQSKSKSGSKSRKQNSDFQELFINTISPQSIQQSFGKKNNSSKNVIEKKKKDVIVEEKPKKQKEEQQKSSDKGSNKNVQQQKSITLVFSDPKEYVAKKLLKFSNQKTSTSKPSDRKKTKSPKKKLDQKSSFSKSSTSKGRKYPDKTKIKSSKKKLSTSKSLPKRRKDISSDLIQKSSDKEGIKNVQQKITPVISDPKKYTTKKPLKSSDRKITKSLKQKSDLKKSNSKSSTEGRKDKSPDKKKNAKSPKKKSDRKMSTSKSDSKRRKEKKKEEPSKISEKRQQKLVVKKSEVVFPMKKKEKSLTVNVNEVLRIGSVLERYGLDEQRRKAFEWLAENRNEALKDSPKFAYNLMVAIGDLNISQDLVIKILQIFLQNGSINQKEYHKHFAPLERSTIHISVAQFAHLLNVYGSQYQSLVAAGS